MKRLCILLMLLFTSSGFSQLKLIPTPQKIEMKPGRFTFKNGMFVFASSGGDVGINNSEKFVAPLVEEVKTDFGIQLQHGSPIAIWFIVNHDDFVHPFAGDENYVLKVKPDIIEITADSRRGAFEGMQTLKQLIRANSDANHSIPCCEITDWPTLKYRVWQDDISRGPIPTMDFLKREVRTLSELKYNAMTLYTEHVFKLKKHPDIAPDDGITADQIHELSEYAKQYHVELIGNFQSFGHMAHILSLPAYKDLGDNGWNISPAKEASYKFLADCYSEVAPAYESKLFDINCDEVSLGKEGASKEMVAKLGLAEVYARHINRLCELLKPYGKTPMMWGDIAVQHPDIVPKLPKDLIVLSWGYGAHDSFDDAIEPFTKIGLRFMVCPGVSCWNRIFPDYKTAQINIANYVRDGAKHGAIGMINTSWDDDGENLFNQTWYPFAWGAECGWNPITNETREAREKNFDDAFGPVFYGSPDDAIVKQLWRLSDLRSNPASRNLENRLFWIDDLSESQPKISVSDAEKLSKDADDIAATLTEAKAKATLNADTLDSAIFAAKKLAFMGRSFVLLRALEQRVRDGGTMRSSDLVAVDHLGAEMASLRQEYSRLWDMESRPWWKDRILEKYDRKLAMVKGVPLRVLFSPKDVSFAESADVTILPLVPGGQIYYTLDGPEPTQASPLYTGPITIDKTTTIKARHFIDGKSASLADVATYRTFVLPAKVETNLQTYENFGPVRAFDGERESYFWGNHDGGDIRAGDFFTIELTAPKKVSSIAILTGHRDHPDDILQQGVLEVSTDGKTFEKVGDFKKSGWGEATFDTPREIKSIRLRATADQHGWLIIREMTLE